MARKKPIRYLGIKWQTVFSEIKEVEWRTTKIQQKSYKAYEGALEILNQMNKIDLELMFFLAEQMDESNMVINNKATKDLFNKRRKNKYRNDVINRSFKHLKDASLLIQVKFGKRGLYKVNPIYYFKGEEPSRMKSIRYDLEQRSQPEINRYRTETFDADMARKRQKKKKNNN